MKFLKNLAPVLWLMVSIAVFISGLILIFNTNLAWNIIEFVIAGLITLVGVMYVLSIFIKTTERKLKTFGIGVLSIIGGLALFASPIFIKDMFNIVAGVLGIIIGVLVLINAFKLRSDGAGWVTTFLTGAIYIGLGITMAFAEAEGRLFGLIFGIYLILFSFNIFGDALVSLFGSNEGAKKAKRHIRISPPVVIAAFMPRKLLKAINELVEEDPDELLLISEKDRVAEPDMEIYIHTREGLIPGMGHVDICVDNTVHTYGNYDDATWKMGGFLADGVMVEMGREEHIKEALDVEKKILMVYGLRLGEEQKKGVCDQLEIIAKDLVPWEPMALRAEKGEIEGEPQSFTDVSSLLYNDTKARFFKFKKGNPFKTYYAVGTNCVKLADTVVGRSGIDLLKINGIITPGAYLNYLDRLYERGDSIVVTRRVYSQKPQEKQEAQENQ